METPDIFSRNPPAPERLASPSPSPTEAVAVLEQECQDLRGLLHATFVAVLFLALAVNVFFFKQMRMVQQQVNEHRPVVMRAEREFRQNRHPEISQFMSQLQAYAASHREYQTNILDRYRAALPQYFNTSVPVQPVAPLSPATNNLAPRPPGR